MADEEAPPAAEQEPEPAPPAEEAAPPAEEAPAEDAPPPAEEAPPAEAGEEAPADASAEPPADAPADAPEEAPADAAAEEGEPPPPDGESAPPPEGEAEAPDEGLPAEDAAAEAEEAEAPPPASSTKLEKDDILHDPEIEALEADGMIEEVRVISDEKPLSEEDFAEEESAIALKDAKKESSGELPPDLEDTRQQEKVDQLMASSIDMSKKDVLEGKKRRVLGSIISIRRGDQTYFDRQKVSKYQNSYKLDSDKPFNSEKVEQILKDVLEDALNELIYDPDKCAKQAKWASSAIRAKVKEQEFERYKIICYVSIGEKLCQDIFTILRFLWDVDRDRYALYVHETMNLFAIGLCFGIYYE